MRLADLPTPCLILDECRMDRNLARLRQRVDEMGVGLRPHLKTAKCVAIARRMMPTAAGPATVSTLKEAEQFAAAGVTDILYAVGISPDKLERVARLRAAGVAMTVILDSLAQAHAVAAAGVPALIEIDADAHRSGVAPGDVATLAALGAALGPCLRGVMTHAGGSYGCTSTAGLVAAAEQERAAVVTAATALRAAGQACPVVSVGSTPTSHFAANLSGVTEVRAGVYVFMDLVMAGLGVCTLDDIAISVLATVIGHQPAQGWTLVDAGWMALSRDRGTALQQQDHGYGLVTDASGRVIPGLWMSEANQEHGILSQRGGGTAPPLPVGTRLRILPNHACATAAQFSEYHVVRGGDEVVGVWERFNGW